MIFLVLIILLISDLNAEMFNGRVVDSRNEDGIPDATIFIEELSLKINTDSLGHFKVDSLAVAKYHIDIVKHTYKSLHYEILMDGSSKEFVFKMHPLEFHLDEISVGGELYHSELDRFYNEHSHINESEINRRLRLTLAQTVQNELGMSVRSLGPAPSRPVLHGLSGSRVQINSDGMPAIDMSATSADHAVATDPSSAKSLSIIRGPKTLIYNPSVAGGIVDINRSDIPLDKPHQVQINTKTYYESVNSLFNGVVEAIAPIAGFTVKGNYSIKDAGNQYTPIGTLENTGIKNQNYNFGISRDFEDVFIGTSMNEMHMDYGIPPDAELGHANGVDISMFRRINNLRSAIHNHDALISDIRIDLSRTFYQHNEFGSDNRVSAFYSLENYFSRVELEYEELPLLNHGVLGVQYNNHQMNTSGRVSTPNLTNNNLAFYLFSERRFNQNEIQFSIRNENSWIRPIGTFALNENPARNFNTLSFSTSILRSFNDKISGGISISRSSRIPTSEELYSNGPHLAVYSYEIGNSDLELENSWNIELLSSFDFQNFNIHSTLYTNEYDNFIFTQNTGDTNWVIILPLFQTANRPARVSGMDIGIEYDISDKFLYEGQISYVYGELTDTNTPLPWIPPLRISNEFQYSNKNLNIKIRAIYAAAQNRIDIFEESTDEFFVFNLNADYAFSFNSITSMLTFNVENIFNTEYYNHLSRIKHLMPEAGRNIRIGLVFYY